jgi:hypothetical protein
MAYFQSGNTHSLSAEPPPLSILTATPESLDSITLIATLSPIASTFGEPGVSQNCTNREIIRLVTYHSSRIGILPSLCAATSVVQSRQHGRSHVLFFECGDCERDRMRVSAVNARSGKSFAILPSVVTPSSSFRRMASASPPCTPVFAMTQALSMDR